MISVTAGSRLLVHGTACAVVVRALRAADLEGGWSVAVLGDAAALQAAGLTGRTAVVEFPTDHGPVRLDAEIVHADGSFLLRAPGLRTAAVVEQRREDVRALVRLPLRGTVLAAASAATRSQATDDIDARPDGVVGVVLAGSTQTVSGGGVSLELQDTPGIAAGTTIYLELGMPGGDVAPAVLTVIDHDGPTVRARFVDISPLDRERLVRLVFTRQRADLAERRQDLEAAR
jgi:PilZ domain-containing protein